MAYIERVKHIILLFAVPILLISVACTQRYLVRFHRLSQWKGGGFGMFSTPDVSQTLMLKVWIIDLQNRVREVPLSSTMEIETNKLLIMPTQFRLTKYANALYEQNGRPSHIKGVRLTIWGYQFISQSFQMQRTLLFDTTVNMHDR